MFAITSREYHFMVHDAGAHDKIRDWKKASRKETQELDPNLLSGFIETLYRYCKGFDLMTVPAPSFHTYDNYPIWEVAKVVSGEIGIPLERLFPEKSGARGGSWHSGVKKQVQDIDCPPGRFVLVIDDLATTRHTFRVTSAAIMRKHSFPCCIAIAGNVYGQK